MVQLHRDTKPTLQTAQLLLQRAKDAAKKSAAALPTPTKPASV